MSLPGRDELRQEGHEEDRELRIEQVDGDAVAQHAPGRTRIRPGLDLQRAMFPQRLPGHEQQIGDAGIFHDGEG